MALWILKEANCSREEMRSSFPLTVSGSDLTQRPGLWVESLPHESDTEIRICELRLGPHGNLDLFKSLEHRGVVLAFIKRDAALALITG
jgi:hypothetical protein